MMGIGGPPATNKARLLDDMFDMLSVANTTRCWQGQCGFVDCRRSEMPFTARTNSWLSLYCAHSAAASLELSLSISRSSSVLKLADNAAERLGDCEAKPNLLPARSARRSE